MDDTDPDMNNENTNCDPDPEINEVSNKANELQNENNVEMNPISDLNESESQESAINEDVIVCNSNHMEETPQENNIQMNNSDSDKLVNDLGQCTSQTELHSSETVQSLQNESNNSKEQESFPSGENSKVTSDLLTENLANGCVSFCDNNVDAVQKRFKSDTDHHEKSENYPENSKSVHTVDNSDSVPNDTFEDKSDELLSQLEDELQSEMSSESEGSLRGELRTMEQESKEQKTVSSTNEQISSENTSISNSPSKCTTSQNGNTSSENVLNSDKGKVQTHSNTRDRTEENTGQGDLVPSGATPCVAQASPEFFELQQKYNTLQKLYAEKDLEIKRLHEEKNVISKSLQNALKEKDSIQERMKQINDKASHEEKSYLATVKELENSIAHEKHEHEATKEKLKSHDEAAKRHIQQLQQDLQGRLAQVTRAYEECKREKEGMVVKYAMAEQKNIEMEERMHKNNKKTLDMEKEKNLAMNKFNVMRAEKAKVEEIFGQRNAEILALRREVERLKELRSEQELKTKWHQNKLKTELEAHKETKAKYDDANKKLKQAREEVESVRRECQHLIKQYQEAEVQKSSTLSARINEKESELAQRTAEAEEQQEAHSLVRNQLDTLKRNHKDMVEELRTSKDKITCLEAERLHQEETLERFKNTLQSQKQDNKELYDKLAILEGIEQQLSIEKEKVSAMKTRVDELEELNTELRNDMAACAGREAKHLEFTKRVSDTNAKLQGDNTVLSGKVEQTVTELEALNEKYNTLLQSSQKNESELNEERERRIAEVGALTVKLEEKSKAVDELSQQLEDQKDENKTLKRRHQANIKDLHRQLQQAQRKLEKGSLNGEISSMGSRTSSNNSLNTLGNIEPVPPTNESPPIQEEISLPQEAEAPLVQFVEVDKQVLVEKIVRLQKALARRNEKIDFMQEHITQQLAELQKKTKVIQSYVLREEAGALAPESMDLNKAQLSRKGGIMASMYNHQSRDGHMTMDLSLQINHKLQAVLEDTILKNITLKESMDTLGTEISELSKQNRDLQLQLQKTSKHSTRPS